MFAVGALSCSGSKRSDPVRAEPAPDPRTGLTRDASEHTSSEPDPLSAIPTEIEIAQAPADAGFGGGLIDAPGVDAGRRDAGGSDAGTIGDAGVAVPVPTPTPAPVKPYP